MMGAFTIRFFDSKPKRLTFMINVVPHGVIL
jgi:hypothetical protein